jgi:predicted nuclease of restriction endonuclease-like (RecB) superfamily
VVKLDNELERGFYEQQLIAERWSVTEKDGLSSPFSRYSGSFSDKINLSGSNPC